MKIQFSMRAVFVLVALIAAYFAGWATRNMGVERLVYGLVHSKTHAENEAADLRLEIKNLRLETNACREKKLAQ